MSISRTQRNILWIGIAVIAVCFVGLLLGPKDVRLVLDNTHWTISYSLAAVLTYLSFRTSDPVRRRTLAWFSFGTISYAIGQVSWDIQVATGWNPFPGPSDLFYLMLPVGYLMGAISEIRTRLAEVSLKPMILDAAILITASLSLTLSLYIPKRGESTLLQLFVMAAYPTFFVAATALILLALLHLRPKLHISWVLVFAGLLFDFTIWMIWNSKSLDGRIPDGTLYNSTFTFVSVMLGLGSATWSIEPTSPHRSIDLGVIVLRLLPLISVVASCAAIIACFLSPAIEPVVKISIEWGAIVIFVLAIARQTLLVAEIQASETRYALALRASLAGIWDWDVRSDKVFYSERYRELLGLSRKEFPNIKESFRLGLHPEDAERVWAAVNDHLENGTLHEQVFRLSTKDKGYRWFHSRGQAQWDRNGKPVRMLGSLTDIHDQTVAQQELEHISRLQSAILGSAGYAVIAADPNGLITVFNPAAERLLGYKSEEMVGKRTPEVFHEAEEVAQRAAQFSKHLGRPIAPGFETFIAETQNGEPSVHEWTYIRRDGHRLPVLLSVTRLVGSNGETTGYLGLAADLTENKEAQRLLQVSEAKFASIFTFAPDLLSLSRASDQSFTDVNPAFEKTTGFAKSEVIGKRSDQIGLFVAQADRDAIYTELIKTGKVENYEMAIESKEGEPVPVLLSMVRFEIEGEEYLLGIGRDISEIKQAEMRIRELNSELEARVQERTAALQASNAELESFAYSVSHDLRAPLRGIDGFTRLLEESIGPEVTKDQRHYVNRITTASEKMGEIIDGLLDLSRVTRSAIKPCRTDLSALATEWVQDHQSAFADRKIDWKIKPTPEASVDPRLMSLLLENLLGNAAKYTKHVPQAVIEFDVESADEEWVTYFIRDNGAGFDMAHVDRIFRPFQRLHRVDEFEGTGIGLATVQRIVVRHRGSIWAEGAIGTGSRFLFKLPRAKNK